MNIKDLIVDDRRKGIFRVHRSTMTSPDLLQREWELIFQPLLDLSRDTNRKWSGRATTVVAPSRGVRCSLPAGKMDKYACSSTPAPTGAR